MTAAMTATRAEYTAPVRCSARADPRASAPIVDTHEYSTVYGTVNVQSVELELDATQLS